MNKTAIKNYAIEARKKWIQAISQQAAFYGCTESGSLNDADITKQLADKAVFLTASEKTARSNLVSDISSKGYQNTIEEVAYTWFNRLIAIRFMEVNGYLPSGIRVLSSVDSGRLEPDCVRDYARLDFLNQDKAQKLAAESDEKLYRYILVEQCNALGKIMPKMFTHIGGIAALLLPERLYIKDGLVHDLTRTISEEDFGEQVEIIGWLYQYYISEKKDEVFAALKKNVKITRENIPAATQLFTPDWIVKYMVENSLGRLWLERHPDSNLRAGWKYYLDEAEQTPEVRAQLDTLVAQNSINKPEDIKLIDPCMGSGHILVYAFDVLYQIYQSVGYAERDIPDLIIENNIYGLDIDERTCQLAYFSLMMKARSYNRRFFRREDVPQPQVYSPQGYEDGMEYGSLVKVDELEDMPVQKEVHTLFDTPYEVALNTWNFRRLLHQKYDVVITNPPFMGNNGLGGKLSKYLQSEYTDYKNDTFAAFIIRCGIFAKKTGYVGMFSPYVWMFIKSYEKLRKTIYLTKTLTSLIQFEYSAFEEATVPVCTFVYRNSFIKENGSYFRLVDFRGGMEVQRIKYLAAIQDSTCGYFYSTSADTFAKISGMPVAYWLNRHIGSVFENSRKVDKISETRIGMATANNDLFMRLWFECNNKSVRFDAESREEAANGKHTWFPYSKGGEYRKWAGNMGYVVNWKDDGFSIRNFKDEKTGRIRSHNYNLEYIFKPGLTFTAISSSKFACRVMNTSLFGSGGSGICNISSGEEFYLLGFLNSLVAEYLLNSLSATMNFEVNTIGSLPFLHSSNSDLIKCIVSELISASKSDWDSFETSWDFQTHPLINGEKTISSAFNSWQQEADARFTTLKANEEELNRIFIDIYGLQEELTPEVEDKDVTVRRADLGREIRSFVSYAVGCMFGRYSLDAPGLIYAGGDFSEKFELFCPTHENLSEYTYGELSNFTHGELSHSFYYLKYNDKRPLFCNKVDIDNILPITDADYFEDDIVVRFVNFVKDVYGKDTLAENLEFIASALYPNGNGTARELIRKYFQSDFFKDHCKIYQKRPIYWLFNSGKQNGFKALIYLHRYDKYTVARVRTEYLHPLQRKYEAEIERMNKLADLPETSARDKAAFKKQTEKISKQIAECRVYDQIISHMAAQTIELDLDNGVKVNYEKFQGVDVPRDDGKGSVKMDLLGKI